MIYVIYVLQCLIDKQAPLRKLSDKNKKWDSWPNTKAILNLMLEELDWNFRKVSDDSLDWDQTQRHTRHKVTFHKFKLTTAKD